MRKGIQNKKNQKNLNFSGFLFLLIALIILILIILFFLFMQKKEMPPAVQPTFKDNESSDLFVQRLCTTPVGLVRVGVASSVQRCDDDLFLVHEIKALPNSASYLITKDLVTLDLCQTLTAPEGCKRIANRGCKAENLCLGYDVNCTELVKKGILTQKYCDALISERNG